MSVPTVCPQCGSRMVPEPITDGDGTEIGTDWRCLKHLGGCGYQMPIWDEDYIERQTVAEEEEHRQWLRDYEAYMSTRHTYYVLYVMRNGVYYSRISSYESLDDALAHVRDTYPGLRFVIYRKDYEPAYDMWYSKGKVAEGVA